MHKILYIDDKIENLETFSDAFADYFEVDTLLEAVKLTEALDKSRYDAILVDIHMPKIDGFGAIKLIRRHIHNKETPIVVFSSDSTNETKLRGLESGISDFVSKLMGLDEIILRIKNSIKTKQLITSITAGNLCLNQSLFQVSIENTEIDLTLKEFKILLALLKDVNGFTSTAEIVSFVYNTTLPAEGTLKVHMNNLRKKVSSWDMEIYSKRNIGYSTRAK